MEHKDATDKDLPVDPDATGVVSSFDRVVGGTDREAMLHRELDAQKKHTVPAIRSVPRASFSAIPLSTSPIPRPPIHSLPSSRPLPSFRLEQQEEYDDDATSVFDRTSVRTAVPSVRFPAPNFSPPVAPQPFATIPAIPAAMRAEAGDSQGVTSVKQIELPPTSRREIRLAPPSVFDSVPPQAISVLPPAARASGSAVVAMAITLTFCVLTMVSIAIAVFKPSLIVAGKQVVATAMTPKDPPQPPVVTAAPPAPPLEITVPPVLVGDPLDDLADDESVLLLPESMHGRRVFVDGKAIGDGDAPIVTACGKHKVQLGSTGVVKSMDLPCGGGLHLVDDSEKYGF